MQIKNRKSQKIAMPSNHDPKLSKSNVSSLHFPPLLCILYSVFPSQQCMHLLTQSLRTPNVFQATPRRQSVDSREESTPRKPLGSPSRAASTPTRSGLSENRSAAFASFTSPPRWSTSMQWGVRIQKSPFTSMLKLCSKNATSITEIVKTTGRIESELQTHYFLTDCFLPPLFFVFLNIWKLISHLLIEIC